MENQEERALVFYGDKEAGTLIKRPGGFDFVYRKEYRDDPDAMPISLALPLREEKYESNLIFPFFDGLLPEGWLLDLTCLAAKIDKNDKFRLLLSTGRDPMGAVSVRPAEESRER
jgi:serine/threonine-protein kinase HipA